MNSDQSTSTVVVQQNGAQTPIREAYELRSRRRKGNKIVELRSVVTGGSPGPTKVDVVDAEQTIAAAAAAAANDDNANNNHLDDDNYTGGTVDRTGVGETTTANSMNELVHWASQASPDELLLHPIVQIALEKGVVKCNYVQRDGQQPRASLCVSGGGGGEPRRWKTKAELKQTAEWRNAVHLPGTDLLGQEGLSDDEKGL